MTSPAEPASKDASQVRQTTNPLRELAALVLLGANALFLFVGLLRLLVPLNDYSTFTNRAANTFGIFVGVEAIVLPLLAVLLATHIQPITPRAKLIVQVALAEYAFSALLGLLTFLVATFGQLADGQAAEALLGLLTRLGYLALFGIAALVLFKIWRAHFNVPKPKAQPGVYGQPQPGQYGYPGGYPQQGGYPGQPGQPGQPGAPGQYGYPQSTPYGAPQQAPGGQYGAPQSAPPAAGDAYNPQSAPPFGAPQSAPPAAPFGAPQSAPPAPGTSPFGAPQSAPPAPGTSQFGAQQSAPQSAPPAPAAPFGQPPSAEPTQAIPRPEQSGDERTQLINPGSQQPSAGGPPPATNLGDEPTAPR